MKIQHLGDITKNKDILDNPKDYISIGNKFYKKNDKKVILLSNGNYVLKTNDHVRCFITNEWLNKKTCINIRYVKNKEIKEIHLNSFDVVYKSSNDIYKVVSELFPELSDDELQIFIEGKYINETSGKTYFDFRNLLASVYKLRSDGSGPSSLNPIFLCRYSQIEELKAYKSLGVNRFYLNSEKPYDRSTLKSGVYQKGQSFKYKNDKYNSNLIANNNFTFGVELETAKGTVPIDLFSDYNLRVECTRDGSITGGEYVTGILQKDRGFYDLYKICRILSKYTQVDTKCGVHVHIGNIFFNKSFTNLAYILGYKIQNELFSYLHKSRKDNPMCGFLEPYIAKIGINAYNQFSTKIADKFFYSFLYKKMTHGKQHLNFRVNKAHRHHGGRFCGRYQNPFNGAITSDQFRYKWLNFISCNFNQRGSQMAFAVPSSLKKKVKSKDYPYKYLTLEFRPYQATLNYFEIELWILFCMAFCSYVVNNSYKILNNDIITVKDVILDSYPMDVYERFTNLKKSVGSKTPITKQELSFNEFIKYQKINKNKKINVSHNT